MAYLRLLAGMTLLVGAGLVWQPYSVVTPGSSFDEPAHRYFAAALRRDSVTLRRLVLSEAAVEWGLGAARNHPDALSEWAGFAGRSASFERGDTTVVLFDTPARACPVVLIFVGRVHPRVRDARARCYLWRGWPTDPSAVSVSR